MSKKKTIYICDSCGNESPKWQGQCSACNQWNTIKEFKLDSSADKKSSSENKRPISIEKVKLDQSQRLKSKIGEFNRVLGGGLVPGSVLLLSGQPGIGKSTLLLQFAASLSGKTLYLSGEESESQIKTRYERLGLENSKIDLLSSQDIGDLERALSKDISLIIVDSIQTVYDSSLSQSSGGVAQIKACGYRIARIAKKSNIPIIITGHITKQGRIAGPKSLEHLVDGVFYLEGDSNYNQRVLKAIKNRFGSTGEVGIFKMTRNGLEEVSNPSSIFLSDKLAGETGRTTASIMEGQRSLLIEVQALAERTVFGYPKRRSQGISANRLEVLSAVITNKTSCNLSDRDVYVNIVGGISVDEPSIDLPVCLSIISSVSNKPVNNKMICFGEVGLSGEVRQVSNIENRLREAKKQGYSKALISKTSQKFSSKTMEIVSVGTLKEAVKQAF